MDFTAIRLYFNAMRNILLTTDFSPESKAAYPVAIDLAQAIGAKINLLFVSQSIPVLASGYSMESPGWYMDPEIQNQITSSQKNELEAEKAAFNNMEIETIFIEGGDLPNSEIIKAAQNIRADFIVMASHGRTGFARIIMGSITERVLRDSSCPVVVVPTKSSDKKS